MHRIEAQSTPAHAADRVDTQPSGGCLSGGAEGQDRLSGFPALGRRSAGQSSLVEPVEQAGLALVASAQFQEWFGERGRVALPGGERLQVP
jgi:hypothetical protein